MSPFTLIVTHIHRGIQKLANGNVGVSDLQQAQPLGLRTLAKERRTALFKRSRGCASTSPMQPVAKMRMLTKPAANFRITMYKQNAAC
jgi:hypothetical protein